MTDKVVDLPVRDNMTVEECLSLCVRRQEDFADVVVLGYGHDGEWFTFSSAMSRKDALWLAMLLVDHARGLVE